MLKSKIKWTNSTVNFWSGCVKVSEGCKFCYMHRMKVGSGQDPRKVTRGSDEKFYEALNWEKGRMIFTCSMSDFFIEDADDWRDDAWDVIRKTPQHSWQILTKRTERILECLPKDWNEGWDNVWLGTSIESNKYLEGASILAKVPAKIRFISAEPLLEQININNSIYENVVKEKFHWCIIGGESGNETGPYKYRECKQEWIEKIVNDLKDTGIKIFVKQMGSFLGKELGMRDKNGEEFEKFPVHLQIQEWPDTLIKTNSLNIEGEQDKFETRIPQGVELAEIVELKTDNIIENENKVFDGAELFEYEYY